MSRLIAIGILGLMGLSASPLCLGQARDRRLDEALADIALLKRLIAEQDRRIADLEKTIKSLHATAVVPEPPPAERAKPVVRPPAAKWQNPLAWGLIAEGMSRAQVEDILGKPATVEAVIDYQTLIYKTDASSPRPVTGSVKLTDDRVSQVNPPVF